MKNYRVSLAVVMVVFGLVSSMGLATKANASGCKPEQRLVCVQNPCPHGSIGCRENPPAPSCFCVDPAQRFELAPLDETVND